MLSVLVLTGVHFGLFAVAAFGYCLIYVIATWCRDVGRQLSGFLLFLFPLFPSHDFCRNFVVSLLFPFSFFVVELDSG